MHFYRRLNEAWRGFSKSSFPAFDYHPLPLLGILLVSIAVFVALPGFLVTGLRNGHKLATSDRKHQIITRMIWCCISVETRASNPQSGNQTLKDLPHVAERPPG